MWKCSFGHSLTRSFYISIENPLHRQSEKACMCFKTRRVRTRDFTVCIRSIVCQSAGLPESLVNVLSFCKNLTYSMFSIFLMLLLSSHRVFSPMYSSKPSMVWKPLWCKYRTVLSLGVIYKLFCRQCSWKEDRKNQSIFWVSPVQWYTMGSKRCFLVRLYLFKILHNTVAIS